MIISETSINPGCSTVGCRKQTANIERARAYAFLSLAERGLHDPVVSTGFSLPLSSVIVGGNCKSLCQDIHIYHLVSCSLNLLLVKSVQVGICHQHSFQMLAGEKRSPETKLEHQPGCDHEVNTDGEEKLIGKEPIELKHMIGSQVCQVASR
jgi:hypothetical protein